MSLSTDTEFLERPPFPLLARQSIHTKSAASSLLWQFNLGVTSLMHATSAVELELIKRPVMTEGLAVGVAWLHDKTDVPVAVLCCHHWQDSTEHATDVDEGLGGVTCLLQGERERLARTDSLGPSEMD